MELKAWKTRSIQARRPLLSVFRPFPSPKSSPWPMPTRSCPPRAPGLNPNSGPAFTSTSSAQLSLKHLTKNPHHLGSGVTTSQLLTPKICPSTDLNRFPGLLNTKQDSFFKYLRVCYGFYQPTVDKLHIMYYRIVLCCHNTFSDTYGLQ